MKKLFVYGAVLSVVAMFVSSCGVGTGGQSSSVETPKSFSELSVAEQASKVKAWIAENANQSNERLNIYSIDEYKDFAHLEKVTYQISNDVTPGNTVFKLGKFYFPSAGGSVSATVTWTWGDFANGVSESGYNNGTAFANWRYSLNLGACPNVNGYDQYVTVSSYSSLGDVTKYRDESFAYIKDLLKWVDDLFGGVFDNTFAMW